MLLMQGGDHWTKTNVNREVLCDRSGVGCYKPITIGMTHYVEKGTRARLCWRCYESAVCSGRIER